MTFASVELFFDRKGNILLIPGWKDCNGVGHQSKRYISLDCEYTKQFLGKEIINALDFSKLNEQEDRNQKIFLKAGNVKSWSAFQKNMSALI